MPRSATKSKSDKPKGRASAKETTPVDLEPKADAVIPQRFNQVMWTNMLIQEDTDEVVGEIMDDLLIQVMDGCYKVYMERQLAHSCASWAKSYITQILEHKFWCLDAEGLQEASITEDSEPLPAPPDSWAQGCVPVIHTTHQPHPTIQKNVDSAQKQCDVITSLQKQDENESSSQGKLKTDTHYNVLSPLTPPETNRQRKKQVTVPPKAVPSKSLPSLSCSTAKQIVEGEGKKSQGSVDRRKCASLHHLKDCKPIPKLDPLSLPRHWIVPQYEVVDNNKTKAKPKRLC
ncbi:unnamed protein product, partial [Menidia menidia]